MPEGSFNLVYKTGVERESGVQAPPGRGSLKLSIEDAHLVKPGSKHHGTRQRWGLLARVFDSRCARHLYSSNLTRTSMTFNGLLQEDG
jgi:hypothetical protein